MSLPLAKKVEIPQDLLDLIRDDEELFRSMSSQEMAKYGGKWIATKGKQVVAAADSLSKLYRELDAKKLRPACISYIEDPSYVVIYALHSLCALLKIMPLSS
jgi:hypothetical protein